MAIVATVESSGLWIVDHLVWLQRTYESHNWSPVDVFDIRTPYLMDLQAKKLASQMEAKEEAPPSRKRKRKEREAHSHPDVDHMRAVLASNKDLMDRCFSASVSSEEYRRNNGDNRSRVAQLNEQTGLNSLKTCGENLSDAVETTRIDGLTYLIPPKACFCVEDLQNLMQLPLGPKYDVILIDPPWENKHLKRINKRPRHDGYSLMSLDKMTRHFDEVVDHLLDPLDGMVMFWSTNSPKQQQEIQQWSRKWNLPVKARWFWLKVTKSGQPITELSSKNDHKFPFELIWILTRSSVKIPDLQVIVSIPSGFHSHKPPLNDILKSLNIINAENNTRCLEIFGRYLQPGWTTIGNEALKFQHLCMFKKIAEDSC